MTFKKGMKVRMTPFGRECCRFMGVKVKTGAVTGFPKIESLFMLVRKTKETKSLSWDVRCWEPVNRKKEHK